MKIALQSTFITDNSKECEAGCLWFLNAQNAKFRHEAEQRGAKIIEFSECKRLLKVADSLKIIGLTGTNGKTTTAAIIAHLLNALGYKAALCGTRGAFIGDERIGDKGLTTAPLLQTLHYMALASKAGCAFFVMEVSSHALAQGRSENLHFAAKIYTNLTQDHLDFHKDFAHYKGAKESFFADECLKFINADAAQIAYNPANALKYAVSNEADYSVLDYDLSEGIRATLNLKGEQCPIKSSLVGLFNLYNVLAAIACINELVRPNLEALQAAVCEFKGVSGRVEEVARGVIVDFAHTPDGIEKVLGALSHNSLIVVFGAGGDRDKTKRALMGRVAKKFASKLIITSDNPRSENPNAIIADIISGIERDNSVFIEPDRKKAIKKALEMRASEDLVVILGKGDEDYQEIKGVKHPFSDKEVVRELLGGLEI